MMKKGLYVTATPIGNLGDISERAKEALKAAEYIACEDTRVTRKLFSLLGIGQDKTFIAYEDHSEEERAQKIIDLINREETAVVLVSDAGSPLISDPGYKLVRKCREQKVPVYVLPGCCAVISALQLSGLPTNRFMFAGFIPNREKARADLFAELAGVNTTLVFYETAPRLTKTLAAAVEFFRGRELAVAREMTKMFEECVNGGAEELIAHFTQNPPKGEIVLMVAPPAAENKENIDLNGVLKELMKTMPLKSAVNEAVKTYGLNKNEVYRRAVEIKNEAKGHWAEFLARLLFRLKGYRIVAVNYVTGRGTNAGEVDFVACRQNVIVFVEVKQRSSLEKAAYAVKPRQQRRIWRAAEAFLQKHPQYAAFDVRFDAVTVCLPFKIRHLPDAFRF